MSEGIPRRRLMLAAPVAVAAAVAGAAVLSAQDAPDVDADDTARTATAEPECAADVVGRT
ncbi:hypothetical protein FB566_3789 [Stackebrandtia endophytica]|uniref:Uncharacterized protein n=1 Tax=Stackebrandtia endophytica TaxID=1496996 RepID=A0A543B041_9ACTN|nr:hypothetical protein [Stackebrandtia endophytica]TQL78207.1 hypothetical protein FB566_3789 [Stackebrandtia endophytica]